MILIPSELNTSSKLAVNFESRSRMRNVADGTRPDKSELGLRACRVTQPPAGLAVTPER